MATQKKLKKQLELIENGVSGIDFIIEKDAGNPILILTGKKENSLAVWKDILYLAEQAIEILEN